MLDLPAFLTFYTAVLALQLAPGPDMILLLSRGVGQGRRTAVLTAIGMTLVAGLIQLPLLALGVSSVIQASPLAFDLLRWSGAAYLVWLGGKLVVGSFRGSHGLERKAAQPISDAAALRQGMINNLTNPKAMVFMLAFLPQFVDPTSAWPVTGQLLFLGAVQKISGFFVLGGVALGAGAVGDWLSRRPGLIAWQERFAGLIMVALGLRLAFSGDASAMRR
ncbi:threonine/homoserine/homoserine lactone efflux protein [Microvirga flocculans]|uniref:Threonine/homoserine/homoserine lactone efflux protein n=1 Tax=Microvirga flocculans TaxID=217168 RepID=A0A7W6IF91_9HYPH|nr:LysE family translocator [Microvirga flocculans]MBB4040239.1 threonine/homoserine/homoserine lactone efflux protein [Microvirga flocculans]